MSVVSMPHTAPLALDLLEHAETAIDDLLLTGLSALDDAEVRRLLHTVERLAAKLSVAGHDAVTEISDRGLHNRWGHKNLRRMLVEELHLAPGAAARRLRVAAEASQLRSLTGEVLEPRREELAAAMVDGQVDEARATAVLDVLDRVPAACSPEEHRTAEAAMVEAARSLPPREIGQVGDRLLAHLDPDGSLSHDGDRARNRGLTVGPQDRQLMSKLTAVLDPATRAMLDVLLEAWAAPGRNNPDDPASPQGAAQDGDDQALADDAARRDSRGPAQRRHDALAAMLRQVLSTGSLGDHRGMAAKVVVSMSIDQLETLSGVATTYSGGDIPVDDAVELAKRTSGWIAVLDPERRPLYLGRTRRLASVAQRIAIWLRDRGCTRPGCGAPVSRTQAHHVTDWAAGGPTDVDALTPACHDCHPMVGDGPEQWETVMVPDGPYRGRCAWIPPASLDPQRRPRVNHHHHPDELLAEAWGRVTDGRDRPPPGSSDPWL